MSRLFLIVGTLKIVHVIFAAIVCPLDIFYVMFVAIGFSVVLPIGSPLDAIVGPLEIFCHVCCYSMPFRHLICHWVSTNSMIVTVSVERHSFNYPYLPVEGGKVGYVLPLVVSMFYVGDKLRYGTTLTFFISSSADRTYWNAFLLFIYFCGSLEEILHRCTDLLMR